MVPVGNWISSTENTYSFTTQFPEGSHKKYVVDQTGIYYLTANIIFKEVNGAIALLISVNSDKAIRNSLHSKNGNPSSVAESLSVAAPLLLNRGRTLLCYVILCSIL